VLLTVTVNVGALFCLLYPFAAGAALVVVDADELELKRTKPDQIPFSLVGEERNICTILGWLTWIREISLGNRMILFC
jgi:hypothetical protein